MPAEELAYRSGVTVQLEPSRTLSYLPGLGMVAQRRFRRESYDAPRGPTLSASSLLCPRRSSPGPTQTLRRRVLLLWYGASRSSLLPHAEDLSLLLCRPIRPARGNQAVPIVRVIPSFEHLLEHGVVVGLAARRAQRLLIVDLGVIIDDSSNDSSHRFTIGSQCTITIE